MMALLDPIAVSKRMKAVKCRDTGAEIAFRQALWKKGIRYRTCVPSLPGKPDVVISKAKVAVFIDGDYWHGGQWAKRRHLSIAGQFQTSANAAYWLRKIRRNMRRDAAVTSALLTQGWTVLRFWESEIHKNMETYVNAVANAIDAKPETSSASLLPQKTVAEFFAGIGLMRLGLEKAGWTVAFANDIDPDKRRMYDEHFGDTADHFHLQDVHQLDVGAVPSVTIATASFPCNDLSLAGGRAGLEGKNSSAFWGFVRVLREMGERRPPIVLLENVVGFLTSHKGEDFRKVLLALNELGYAVDSVILDAAWFVPQSRQRLFVIGVRDGSSAVWRIRERQMGFFESAVRPKALADFILCNPDIRWTVRDLPAPEHQPSTLSDILEDLPHNAPEWWNPARAEYFLKQMSERHRLVADRMIAADKYSYGTAFRRVRNGQSMAELRTDGVAGCLRTPRGGSGRQILFKAGKGEYFVRLLTPRECARLMGAPDYRIEGTLNQALFGFGDAVCVPVVEWLANNYLDPLVTELTHGRALQSRAT